MKGLNLLKVLAAPLWLIFQCLPVLAQPQHAEKGKSRPNVIIILTDDMGVGDIGAFGGSMVPTPHIDKLAASGLKLTNYYSGAPICSPSRASILTGMYPGKWNFATYLDKKSHNKDAEQADFLNPEAASIARFFKNSGYATGHFGKWHMGGGRDVTDAPKFARYGIDEHASTYESPEPDPLLTATNWIWSDKDSIKRWNRTAYFIDKTLDFMSRHRDQPCFVNLWPDDVHTPWVPEPEVGEETLKPQSETAFKHVLKEYDIQIGRLIDGLKARGLFENTIIIFTSDNGALPTFRGSLNDVSSADISQNNNSRQGGSRSNGSRSGGSRSGEFRGSKLSLYEGGIRMPFIVTWPGHIPAGRTDETSELHATDLLPTLSKLSEVLLPANYKGDGVDRSAVLLGKSSPRKKEMFWEYGRNTIAYAYPKGNDKSPQLAVRSGNWKLLINHDGTNAELYNIVKDPAETNNVASSNIKKRDELTGKLLAWWKALPRLEK